MQSNSIIGSHYVLKSHILCFLFSIFSFLKSIFDVLEEEELRKARSRSNPFETIRGAFFLNRAAMKMANMDAVFDFMFTDPTNEDGVSYYFYKNRAESNLTIMSQILFRLHLLGRTSYFILLTFALAQEDFLKTYWGEKNGKRKVSVSL